MDVSIGRHAAVIVPSRERERVRRFYCDVLGAQLVGENRPTYSHGAHEADDFQIGDSFFLAVLYGDIDADEERLRSGRSIYLELVSGDVDNIRKKIVEFGVAVLDIPDPHLYFQAPGGQVFRLVSAIEDLSRYEGR